MAQSIKKGAPCYGQKFGHDFPVISDKCSKCGINQTKLSDGLQKIEYFVKKPERGIHSEAHALAKEISEFCGEPKKFGMYLGVIKNIGLPRAYQIFAEMRQAKEIKTPGKLFLYLSAYKPSTTFLKKVVLGKKSVNEKPNGKSKRKTNEHHYRTGKNTAQKTKKRGKNNTGN